jgi:hypothetical protein
MAHKKIKFSTLQRLDLKDANELQQGVLDRVSTLVKSIDVNNGSTLKQGGVLTKQTVQGVTNGIVTFGPVKAVTAEGDDVISLSQDDVDSGLTQLDISAIFSTYVAQINNGVDLSGIYFYAYPLEEDTDVESREFYNTIESSAESRNVSTRSRKRLTFFALIDNSSYSVADSNGKQPIYLGKVLHDDLILTNTSSPFISSNFKSGNYFDSLWGQGEDWDDTSYTNAGERVDFSGEDNLSDGNSFSGLKLIFKRLERQLNRIVSYGSADSDDTILLPLNYPPQFSLQGLNEKFVRLIGTQSTNTTNLENKFSTATVIYTYNRSSGLSSYFFAQDAATQDFAVTGDLNWALALENGTASAGDTFGDLDDDANAMGDLCTSLVFQLPSSLLGKRIISINVQTINPGISENLLSVAGDLSGNDIYNTRILTNNSSNTYNEYGLVRNETWKDNNGVDQSGPALLFKVGPEINFQNDNRRFGIQFTFTIDNRS